MVAQALADVLLLVLREHTREEFHGSAPGTKTHIIAAATVVEHGASLLQQRRDVLEELRVVHAAFSGGLRRGLSAEDGDSSNEFRPNTFELFLDVDVALAANLVVVKNKVGGAVVPPELCAARPTPVVLAEREELFCRRLTPLVNTGVHHAELESLGRSHLWWYCGRGVGRERGRAHPHW
jgi:hypothetical protein